MSRESQTDNAKHGVTQTKQMHSTPIVLPPNLGGWDAPGVEIVTDDDDNEQLGEENGTI